MRHLKQGQCILLKGTERGKEPKNSGLYLVNPIPLRGYSEIEDYCLFRLYYCQGDYEAIPDSPDLLDLALEQLNSIESERDILDFPTLVCDAQLKREMLKIEEAKAQIEVSQENIARIKRVFTINKRGTNERKI